MGIALGPSLPGGPVKPRAPGPGGRRRRVGDGARPDGSFDRSLPVRPRPRSSTWAGSAAPSIGVLGGGLIPHRDYRARRHLSGLLPRRCWSASSSDGRTVRRRRARRRLIALAPVRSRRPASRARREPRRARRPAPADGAAGVSATGAVILGTPLVTFAIKAAGPVLSGGRKICRKARATAWCSWRRRCCPR